MKISEVIEALQKIKAAKGDLDLCIWDSETDNQNCDIFYHLHSYLIFRVCEDEEKEAEDFLIVEVDYDTERNSEIKH